MQNKELVEHAGKLIGRKGAIKYLGTLRECEIVGVVGKPTTKGTKLLAIYEIYDGARRIKIKRELTKFRPD